MTRTSGSPRWRVLSTASVLQASGFRLNARSRRKTGSERAFQRNAAEPVYIIEAAHNPEVAGSNPAPATAAERCSKGCLSLYGRRDYRSRPFAILAAGRMLRGLIVGRVIDKSSRGNHVLALRPKSRTRLARGATAPGRKTFTPRAR